jgi:hypothetical protein
VLGDVAVERRRRCRRIGGVARQSGGSVLAARHPFRLVRVCLQRAYYGAGGMA